MGGGTNFIITAARLGLRVGSCGNVGADEFGSYLLDAISAEGVQHHVPLLHSQPEGSLLSTLLCFVLVERLTGRHSFVSAYDFGPWPLLEGFAPANLSAAVLDAVAQTRAIMMNGLVFDELRPDVVMALVRRAREAGNATFFDPGMQLN